MSRLVALLGLCSLVLVPACVRQGGALDRQTTQISVDGLLAANRVAENPTRTSVFVAEAIRKVWVNGTETGKSSTTFERLIRVARNGRLFRYERIAEAVPTKQIDVFDGNAVHHLISARDKLIADEPRPGESASEQVMFELKTFGLLPILKRLIDSKAQSEFEGPTDQGLDRIRVNMPDRPWILWVDAEQLIRRLEIPDNAIDYDDYREIQGVRLPFKQRFFHKGQLYYELSFSSIDLNPIFPAGYFTREAALKELKR